jgi:hypothetical protein
MRTRPGTTSAAERARPPTCSTMTRLVGSGSAGQAVAGVGAVQVISVGTQGLCGTPIPDATEKFTPCRFHVRPRPIHYGRGEGRAAW